MSRAQPDATTLTAFWQTRNLLFPAVPPTPLDTPIPLVSFITLDAYQLFADLRANPLDAADYALRLLSAQQQHQASIAAIKARVAAEKSYHLTGTKPAAAQKANTAALLAGLNLKDLKL